MHQYFVANLPISRPLKVGRYHILSILLYFNSLCRWTYLFFASHFSGFSSASLLKYSYCSHTVFKFDFIDHCTFSIKMHNYSLNIYFKNADKISADMVADLPISRPPRGAGGQSTIFSHYYFLKITDHFNLYKNISNRSSTVCIIHGT